MKSGLAHQEFTDVQPEEQRVVRAIIDDAFVFAFRLVMIGAAALAFAAAVVGGGIRKDVAAR